MSDGIELRSPCCNNTWATNKEYDQFKIKDFHRGFTSHIPVYTCHKCGKKWVIELVYKNGRMKQ